MADEPVFPKPRPKGSAYREPVAVPVIPERTPKLVKRADPPMEKQESTEAARALLTPVGDEQAYWAKQQFVARHPRITGAVMLALSLFLVFPAVAMRLEGHHYRERSSLFGAVFFTASIWLLAAGMPLESNGRPPPWWAIGMTACTIVGGLVGVFVL